MKGLLGRMFAPFSAAKVASNLSGSFARLDRLEAGCHQSVEILERRAKELDRIAAKVAVDVENARKVHARYEHALDEVREQNKVLETTIQTLVASHKLLMERADAECAIEVRKRVAMSGRDSL